MKIKLFEEFLNETEDIIIDGKKVDYKSLEVEGIDPKDRPDFVDAFISNAEFDDGEKLSDKQIDQLNDKYCTLAQEVIISKNL